MTITLKNPQTGETKVFKVRDGEQWRVYRVRSGRYPQWIFV